MTESIQKFRRPDGVEVQYRRYFMTDFGQELECFGIQALLFEQPGVDECGGDVRRKLPQDVGVAL